MTASIELHPFTIVIQVHDPIPGLSNGVMFWPSFWNMKVWMCGLIDTWWSHSFRYFTKESFSFQLPFRLPLWDLRRRYTTATMTIVITSIFIIITIVRRRWR